MVQREDESAAAHRVMVSKGFGDRAFPMLTFTSFRRTGPLRHWIAFRIAALHDCGMVSIPCPVGVAPGPLFLTGWLV